MKLYHGTSDINLKNIIENGFNKESWFAKHIFHAYRLAIRKVNKTGGEPIILEIEVLENDIMRVVGRDLPTYKINVNGIKPINKYYMSSEKISV